MPTADVSVRVAWPADAAGIAEVLLTSWYGDRLSARLDAAGLGKDDLVASERLALTQPPDARCRALVALEGAQVVGVARTAPATDPDAEPNDGEVLDFLVSAEATGAGHGSRLLQACADTLRADRFTRAVQWVRTDDDALRSFLESAGWAPDGAVRELTDELSGQPLRQVRLHTALG